MTTTSLLLLLGLLAFSASTYAIQSEIYAFLNLYGLPPGILPDSVIDCNITPSSNYFVLDIELEKPCYIKYDDYVIHFNKKIYGYLDEGRIDGLKGLQAQFSTALWAKIDEMTSAGESIAFTGNINFDRRQFETVPTCTDEPLAAACEHSSNLTTSKSKEFYAFLNSYGLPSGILPDSVISYATWRKSGASLSLSIILKKPCYVKYHDYLAHFDSAIIGRIINGGLYNLKGIQVQLSGLWVNVNDIISKADGTIKLSFTKGNLDRREYETIPTCKDEALPDHHSSNLNISKLPINAEEVDI